MWYLKPVAPHPPPDKIQNKNLGMDQSKGLDTNPDTNQGTCPGKGLGKNQGTSPGKNQNTGPNKDPGTIPGMDRGNQPMGRRWTQADSTRVWSWMATPQAWSTRMEEWGNNNYAEVSNIIYDSVTTILFCYIEYNYMLFFIWKVPYKMCGGPRV